MVVIKQRYLLILYLLFITFLIIFSVYDQEFNISMASLINIILFITIIYLCLALFIYFKNKKAKELLLKDVENLKMHKPITYYQNNILVSELIKENKQCKDLLNQFNEQQNNWLHDIKIPLATLNLFLDNNTSKYDHEDLTVLKTIYLDLSNQINKKITLDHLELGLKDYHFEMIELQPLLVSIIKSYKAYFLIKGISIDMDIPNISVLSDYKHLRNALEQIVNNAFKYASSNSQVKITFKNNTLSIKNDIDSPLNDDVNDLFKKGYSGANHKMSDINSTGIGLYLVQQIITDLGNQVSIEATKDSFAISIKFNKVVKLTKM